MPTHAHVYTHKETQEGTHMALPSSLFDPLLLCGIFMISNTLGPQLISLSSHGWQFPSVSEHTGLHMPQ